VKRPALAVLVVVSLVAAAAACRQYLPQNRYLRLRTSPQMRSTADARGKFDHQRHAKPLASLRVTCLDCHRFDAQIETSNEGLADELSRSALFPGSTPCHFCHRESATKMTGAPDACATCHENLRPLRPADHDVAWLKVHGSMARVEPERCGSCHRQAECISCHQSRDSIQTLVHERNFRFFHSIEARANPARCGICHREDFCIRCHLHGGVEGLER